MRILLVGLPTSCQKSIWEKSSISRPSRIKSALDIILDAPIGAASYNNEFGRPNIFGFFRTCEFILPKQNKKIKALGYHKPIMLAGGIGTIRPSHAYKSKLQDGDLIIILGGPSYLIGIGGGAAGDYKGAARAARAAAAALIHFRWLPGC